MTRSLDTELMRLLHGELPPADAAALRERMQGSPELAAAYERLERTWGALDLPPSPGVPPGFAGRVMARVAATRETAASGALSWGAAPRWVRAAAAACLVAGAALGAGVGARWSAGRSAAGGSGQDAALVQIFDNSGGAEGAGEIEPESLSESYWGEVADSTLEGRELEGLGDGETPSPGPTEETPL